VMQYFEPISAKLNRASCPSLRIDSAQDRHDRGRRRDQTKAQSGALLWTADKSILYQDIGKSGTRHWERPLECLQGIFLQVCDQADASCTRFGKFLVQDTARSLLVRRSGRNYLFKN
jgi:hypothetical protein